MSTGIQSNTKIWLVNILVKPLLYGAETSGTIVTYIKKIKVFIKTSLKKTLKIFWLNKVLGKEQSSIQLQKNP
ncbi:hypothetical protein DPMN_127606 [Dreissena polymorpha]|uniref:Uncharacterized protein n=1 Tax=Dreissena polymorpha TaxID=45954 RepID=A0A9D4JV00_DREPO|nr:hypothetical protein DPMN_127606 [Dreissena polymorpha]